MRRAEMAIVWFKEVHKGDVSLVGGKGGNLGEMTNARIPVPPGFVVTAGAYFDFLEQAKLIPVLRKTMAPLDRGASRQLQRIAGEVKRLIMDAPMPAELAESIRRTTQEMGGGYVAVRSSATAEDLPDAS